MTSQKHTLKASFWLHAHTDYEKTHMLNPFVFSTRNLVVLLTFREQMGVGRSKGQLVNIITEIVSLSGKLPVKQA
jgi:hypothetical protein